MNNLDKALIVLSKFCSVLIQRRKKEVNNNQSQYMIRG